MVNINNMRVKSVIQKVKDSVEWLKNQKTDMRIIIKQTRNLGDTLHITPIARHYKTLNPKCKIAFLVGNAYANVHMLNKDFDRIVPIDSKLNPQERIMIGKYMKSSITGIDKVLCPSIFPFGEVWKSHAWSWPIISHQYFSNGEIQPGKILGGGKLHAPVAREDLEFAENFVGKNKCIGLEYNSYSHPVPWNRDRFSNFIDFARKNGYICISFAGKNEGLLPNTRDGRGMSWRRTIAVLSKCHYMVGIGSGITMLAACAKPTPKILELNVSDSISMCSCGYADSQIFNNATPERVIQFINKNDGRVK